MCFENNPSEMYEMLWNFKVLYYLDTELTWSFIADNVDGVFDALVELATASWFATLFIVAKWIACWELKLFELDKGLSLNNEFAWLL